MRFKILLISNEQGENADAEMLRERGFLVYTCNESTINEMVNEVQPNVVFLNPVDGNDNQSMDTYNAFLNNITFAGYPVIYTLSEDDVYLVNRKRTTSKENRTVISDNVVDGIRTALTGTKAMPVSKSRKVHAPAYQNRA